MNIKEARIIFMGTPSISAHVFKGLLEAGFNIIGLIAQPDKPVGRKNELKPVPTKEIAVQFNIPVYQPIKIRKDYEFVKELKPDLIITLAYGQILPQGLLDIPTMGCLNLHGSLLPKYRGAAPIQFALINGEKETGMTLMEMTAEMDAGRIYDVKKVTISEEDNSSSLFNKMGEAALELALNAIPKYLNNELIGIEQDNSLVTFCPTIKPEQEHLDLSLPGESLIGWIRGLSDQPGAYLYLDDLKLKIFKAIKINENKDHILGEIVAADKHALVIQASDSQISLIEIQLQGKKRLLYKDFINGQKDLMGKILK